MSTAVLCILFVAAALVSLGASWILVQRLERVGAVLGVPEALLGVFAALAADAPEITTAISATAGHQSRIGAGVVIGSNVLNLAALLGLSSIVAGRIGLHRRVIALEGTVALTVAAACVCVVAGLLGPVAGLGIVLAVLLPYLLVLGIPQRQLERSRLPDRWRTWLVAAIHECGVEQQAKAVSAAISKADVDQQAAASNARPGRDVLLATLCGLVVVGASIGMEHAAARVGTRIGSPQLITGGLVLAAVTSIPNAVAGVYLARRGRGAATLSTVMNSNALNVAVGLLLPAVVVGMAAPTGAATAIAAWYLGLTLLALALAMRARGLTRRDGPVILLGYLLFVVLLGLMA